MGQKVNPHGLRVGVIKDWDSRWYASDEKVGDLIVEDQKIRKYLKKTLYGAGVPKIEIERSNEVVTIFLHCARPGMVIGKGGEQIEQYRLAVEKLIGKKVRLNIVEVRNPDMNAQLVAENIAQQLEKRISHRRAMKNAMARAMRAGAKGIKVCCSGRLGGREIAGVEHYHEGTIPLQTIRADIEYGFAEAATTFGRIGVKVWIYKGEVLSQTLRTTPRTMDTSKPYQERRERRPRRDGDRRGGRHPGGDDAHDAPGRAWRCPWCGGWCAGSERGPLPCRSRPSRRCGRRWWQPPRSRTQCRRGWSAGGWCPRDSAPRRRSHVRPDGRSSKP